MQQADLTKRTPPESAFDLVSALFVLCRRMNANLCFAASLRRSLRQGRCSLWATSKPRCRLAGRTAPVLYGRTSRYFAQPDRCEIVVNEVRERNAVDPEGQTVLMKDAVLRARRLR